MPKATMREQSEYALPEDTLFPATLTSVKERRTTFTYKAHHKAVESGRAQVGEEGVVERWVWEFEITDGEFMGLRAWGETETALSTHPDNLVRQWGEALRGAPFEIGEGLDTDDLIGLPCSITVRHDEPRPRRDGSGMFYGCPVDSVFPKSAVDALPPF